jgi:hypothetical protein
VLPETKQEFASAIENLNALTIRINDVEVPLLPIACHAARFNQLLRSKFSQVATFGVEYLDPTVVTVGNEELAVLLHEETGRPLELAWIGAWFPKGKAEPIRLPESISQCQHDADDYERPLFHLWLLAEADLD